MRGKTVTAVLAMGVLALAGCTGEAPEKGTGSLSTAVGTGTSTTAPKDAVSSSPIPGAPSGSAFGETFKYDDGLAVSVGSPKPFSPSAKATKGPEPDFITVTVSVVNETKTKFSPLDVTVTVASGGGQGGDVLDPASGLGAPNKAIAPGGNATWKLAFGVLNSEKVAVNVQPGIDRDQVIFGG